MSDKIWDKNPDTIGEIYLKDTEREKALFPVLVTVGLLAFALSILVVTLFTKNQLTTPAEEAAHEQLVKDDWHHQDDRGNTNGDVFDYKEYLKDHGATDIKVAAYRLEGTQIQMWQLTWHKDWCGRPCIWSLYTENCDGTNNCYLECNVTDGQNYRTGADMGGEYVYDQTSAFSTTVGIYQEFRRVVENADNASEDCPLAACEKGHYVTDDDISFAVWHDLGT